MKYIVIFSVFIFCLSCSEEKSEEFFVPASFQVDSISVKLNHFPTDIIQFNGGYLCRLDSFYEDSMSLLFLNDKFEIQPAFSRNLNKSLNHSVNAIWTSNDTLFAIQGFKNYTISIWNSKLWQIVDSGGMTRENFMSQELNYPIFEDQHYVVRSCCKGEFGGALFFKHKKSHRTFSCRATCITGVHKIDSSYYITTSIAHASGFSRVAKIDDPKKLFEIKDKKQLFDCSWYDIYTEDPKEEIKHPVGYTRDQGQKTLLDTMGISILGSFDYKNHLYHIYSDWNKSYIGYINNGELKPIDTIYSKPMWLSEIRDLKHNSNIFPIMSRGMKGIILRQGSKLKIVEFLNE